MEVSRSSVDVPKEMDTQNDVSQAGVQGFLSRDSGIFREHFACMNQIP